MTVDDLNSIFEWSQDQEFCLANGWTLGLSRQQLVAWWKALLQTAPEVMLRHGVVLRDHLVGFVELSDFDRQRETAHFGIAIGARSLWGQGIGFQAGQLMLQHGFHHLNLSEIHAEVHAPNLRSLALMGKLGFQETGQNIQPEIYRGTFAEVKGFVLTRHSWERRCSEHQET